MNPSLDGSRALALPAAMAAAFAALWRSTKALKAATSSALVTLCGGV